MTPGRVLKMSLALLVGCTPSTSGPDGVGESSATEPGTQSTGGSGATGGTGASSLGSTGRTPTTSGGSILSSTDSTGGGSDGTTSGPNPGESAFWGNPQIANSLADTEWGGPPLRTVSNRMRFDEGGLLVSIRPYLVFVPGTDGGDAYYHKGDGGTFRVSVQADDGSEEHLPTGVVLAQTGHVIGMPSEYQGSGPPEAVVGGDPGDSQFFRNLRFETPVQLEPDTWYHFVFENTTLDPTEHFISHDDFIASVEDRATKVPTLDPLDNAILYRDGVDGEWTNRPGHWGISSFEFDDGRGAGNGYMEVGSVSGPDRVARYVDAENAVRQVFTVPETMTANRVEVGAMHVEGTNTMAARLVDASGAELWAGEVTEFPTGTPSGDPRGDVSLSVAEFRGSDISPAVQLMGGQTYSLEFEATGGTHTIVGTRDGSLSYSFSEDSTVSGRAEYRDTPEGTWEGWPLRDTEVSDQFDISFFFETLAEP